MTKSDIEKRARELFNMVQRHNKAVGYEGFVLTENDVVDRIAAFGSEMLDAGRAIGVDENFKLNWQHGYNTCRRKLESLLSQDPLPPEAPQAKAPETESGENVGKSSTCSMENVTDEELERMAEAACNDIAITGEGGTQLGFRTVWWKAGYRAALRSELRSRAWPSGWRLEGWMTFQS